MEITEVKIYLREKQDKKLKAYATVTFDNAFVVRDMRIIDGRKGLFVAMPSRKLKESCPRCGHKNVVGSKFCNQCGTNLEAVTRTQQSSEDREEHRDIAHPITTGARESIQKAVLEAYETEKNPPTAPMTDTQQATQPQQGQ